jgi:dTDP-4-dehydrorhamnose reductase
MRLLITGLGGTLAPKLAGCARAAGWEVLGWNRQQVPPEDRQAVAAWLSAQRLDAIAHLGFGPESFGAQLAGYAQAAGLPFLFTSTAMVFHHEPDGPHHPADARTAQDDYGRYKIRCEDAIRAASAAACIVRIGWQIDPDGRGNNMLAALDAQKARDGGIRASARWRPACSFMIDTAAALLSLLRDPPARVVHVDGNAREGFCFLDIVHALRHAYGRDGWTIQASEDYVHDQRLADDIVLVPDLSARLPALRAASRPGSAPS